MGLPIILSYHKQSNPGIWYGGKFENEAIVDGCLSSHNHIASCIYH